MLKGKVKALILAGFVLQASSWNTNSWAISEILVSKGVNELTSAINNVEQVGNTLNEAVNSKQDDVKNLESKINVLEKE